jgi:hypothetical protein
MRELMIEYTTDPELIFEKWQNLLTWSRWCLLDDKWVLLLSIYQINGLRQLFDKGAGKKMLCEYGDKFCCTKMK